MLVAVLLLFGIGFVSGFYLPGIAPKEYEFGEDIVLKVNKMESVQKVLPHDYYQLPFCKPSNVKQETENLGEVMTGEKIENSPYKLQFNEPDECVALCRQTYSKKDLNMFRERIIEEYRVNFIIDNLPAAQKFKTIITESDGTEHHDYIYEKGFPLGVVSEGSKEKSVYLHNHVDLIILHHEDKRYKGGRIVGFEVNPRSIKHNFDGAKWDAAHPEKNELKCAVDSTALKIGDPVPNNMAIVWSYSVIFEKSDIRWASRWDAYLKMQDPQIHWFSILNSFMIVLFLTGMVAMILLRALHKDLRRYNANPEELQQEQEESGWKLVHGDVFRPPTCPSFFATFVGSGVQVLSMSFLTLIFAALGFLSPANRGALMTTLLLLFVFMGVFAGYVAARVYKMLGEVDWQRNTLQTALFYPGLNFVVFFILNLFVWHQESSGAIPFGTLLILLTLWFGISIPLVYLGAYFGYKKTKIESPCKTNKLARDIPPQAWYMQPTFSVLLGGVLPFGAVFIEIFFIMSSIWLHRFYYMFGFLLLVFGILIITSAEITIVMTYFQLCLEDHKWWWRSIFTAGSSALYLFLYSILYFTTKLDIVGFVPTVLYFGYMFLVCVAFFVLTGSIGFFSTFMFVRTIYGAIKVA